MSSPIVSIVIPTYNRATYVTRAIESVLAQTYPNLELLVVDDGSMDDTETMIYRYAAQDARIRFFRQANAGVSAARNRAVAESKGCYVAFLDDDDRWLPDKLVIQVAFMEAHPRVVLSYTRSQLRHADGQGSGQFGESPWPPLNDSPETFEDLLRPFVNITPSRVMVRAAVVRELGGFNTSYRVNEDYELWLRVAQRGRLAALDGALTVTEKDGRSTLSQCAITNARSGVEVLRHLALSPNHQRCEGLRRRHLAYLLYLLAREYYEQGQEGLAAKAFAEAVWYDPLIGLRVRRRGETGVALAGRVVKAYAAIVVCAIKAVSNSQFVVSRKLAAARKPRLENRD